MPSHTYIQKEQVLTSGCKLALLVFFVSVGVMNFHRFCGVCTIFFPQVSLFLVHDFAEHEILKELICAVRVENPLYDFPFSRSSGFQPSLYKSSQWRLTHSVFN